MTRFRDWIYVSLRLPKPLHADIKAMAKREWMSLHAVIVQLLKEGVAKHAPGHPDTAIPVPTKEA